jgi:PAS domain-containing protein
MTVAQTGSEDTGAVDDLRRHKVMFDNTWTLATLLAAVLAVSCWYFEIAQLNIGPVIWVLATLGLLQSVLNSQTRGARSVAAVRRLALVSQLLGTLFMAVGWHLFGGIQQPLFPLFIVLPLVTGTLVLGFWQRQIAISALLVVVASGVLLSADTNSFIQERYGISIVSAHALPSWVPRSRVFFPDMSTSPAYDLFLTVMVGIVCVALSTTARGLIALCRRDAACVASLQDEVARLQHAATQFVLRAPAAILVLSSTGRIMHASDHILRTFDLGDACGRFLLDVIDFKHPDVIKRVMTGGGEEIQSVNVRGIDRILRVRGEVLEFGPSTVTLLSIESCDDLCWRAAMDAVESPVFAVDPSGRLAHLNRSALTVFGAAAEGATATTFFDTGPSAWWEIAPLESARRIVTYRGRSYLASIRRIRVATGLAELSVVHLNERSQADAAAAA